MWQSTIAHQSDMSNFRLPLDEVGDTESRLRLGHAWVVSSRKCFAEVFFPSEISFFVNPSRSSLIIVHQHVLAHFFLSLILCLQPCEHFMAQDLKNFFLTFTGFVNGWTSQLLGETDRFKRVLTFEMDSDGIH